MKVIPAVDIKGGKVVRLAQGSADRETVYPGSPLEAAERWASFGVRMIHVVDLDGALDGKLKNLGIVKEMARILKLKIELGGGMRDIETIREALGAGIEKVCVGTRALDEAFIKEMDMDLKEKIVISIDARNGIVCRKGWVEETGVSVEGLAKRVAGLGFRAINYTDISRDGMLEGPNIASLRSLLAAVRDLGVDVITSGGISNIDDVKKLKEMERYGLKGMIIGKALYEDRIDLGEAVRICGDGHK